MVVNNSIDYSNVNEVRKITKDLDIRGFYKTFSEILFLKLRTLNQEVNNVNAVFSAFMSNLTDRIIYGDFEIKTESNVPKIMRYKNEEELHNKICDFRGEQNLSGGEKAVFNALIKLSPDYRWELYIALHKFIDKFLI